MEKYLILNRKNLTFNKPIFSMNHLKDSKYFGMSYDTTCKKTNIHVFQCLQ